MAKSDAFPGTGPLRIVGPADAPPLVPKDDPAFRFAHWLQREGKGWPLLNSRIAEAMRRPGLDATLFYTDQPLSTVDTEGLESIDFWHYPHTSSGLVTDFNRVANIARLAGKKLSLMPGTIFWDPWPFRVDGKVVSLTPDLLRQFLWIAVAHPLDHLGLYGLGELRQGYVPEGTFAALRQTLADVFPLGLLTGGLPAGPVPVAYLHTEGQLWHGPGDNAWIDYWFNRRTSRALAETRLRYDWIGDEHVAAGWLKNYRAVVVPGAVVLDYHSRGQEAEVIRAMGDWARQFRAAHPEPLRLGDGGEAWLFDKLDGPARFVFLVNDRVEPGLLGAEKKLQGNLGARNGPLCDRGLAQRVRVVLPAVAGQAVYEVRAHRPANVQGAAAELDLVPGAAAVLAVLPEPIGELRASVPPAVSAGSEARLEVAILTSSGKPIAHRDLLEVTATDAQGQRLDVVRYVRVVGGKVGIPLRLALAQPPGPIKIELLEWIAGKKTTLTVDVRKPQPTE